MAEVLTEKSADAPARMPEGVWNAYWFQVFNTMSFVIVVSTPMLLYFKKLGASGTVLGIVVALPALMNILQIPAAQFVEKIGYRAFVLSGWTLRSAFVLGIAGVAMLPSKIDPVTRIALLLFLLFAFNASRGISLCGYLPWMTHLIPEGVRGRYVSGDQTSAALAQLGTMIVSTIYLKAPEAKYAYGLLFVGGFVAILVSLWFLQRIPDVPVTPMAESMEKVPYKEMLFHPPFFRLMVYNAVLLFSIAGAGVIWIPLLRDSFAATDSLILGMMVLWSFMSAVALWGFGRLVDRVGSRPLLGLATLVLVVHLSLWGSVAAHALPFGLLAIILVQSTSAIGMAAFNLANTRLVMASVPAMGRSHFFALYTVVTSLVSGIFPIFWGMLLDALAGWGGAWSRWQWNPYSLLYVAMAVGMCVAVVLRSRVTEARAMTTDAFLRELLVKTPSRAISRLLPRRPVS
ncbi:MAG TPA: MFS transporter [Verrucomicrobiae bacterium]|nr:MFS transporter [Verrucomicrobiae bacterium]